MAQELRVLTDSGCDLPLDEAYREGLVIVPFPITAGGETWIQGENFTTAEEFYGIMDRSPDIPKHAQITPVRYAEEYARLYAEGCRELIVVTITSTASATCHNATAAAQLFYEQAPGARERLRIHVVDSRCYSVAYGYPALQAARMARQGRGAEDILPYLREWFSSMEIYVSAYSLEYARRSGRIGAASAVVGEALGVRPIISLIDGQARTYRKVRGNAAVAGALADIALARMRPGSPYGMLYGTFPGAREALHGRMVSAVGYEPFGMYPVGPAVALNIGPKMLGIGFLTGRGAGDGCKDGGKPLAE